MRTPAGSDCPYYFEDFHRGRNRQECRLVAATPGGKPWSPDLCKACRVPGLARANACPNLVLNGKVQSGLLGLGRRVEVAAECTLSRTAVSEPEIGCGRCHESFEARISAADEP